MASQSANMLLSALPVADYRRIRPELRSVHLADGEKLGQCVDGSTRDAALIASAQKVEHYEIATYGTQATFADVLDMQDAKDLLGETLEEEKKADQKLT